MKYVALKFKNI